MALSRLTKVDGGGISTTSDYRVGVITATKFVGPVEGSITATDASFSGNVTIGGTLTYEDVTNVDSLGIVTATAFHGDGSQLTGIVAGLSTISGIVNVANDLDVDGHTNLDNVSVAGVSTFASDIHIADSIIHQGDTDTKIEFATNDIRITASNKLRIHHTSNGLNYFNGNNISQATSTHTKLAGSDYVHRFRDEEGDDTLVQFFNTNVKNSVFEWNAFGNSTTAGNLIFRDLNTGKTEYARFTGTGSFNIAKDLDVDGHTNLDNVSIAGVTTMTGNLSMGETLTISGNNPNVTFTDTNSNPDYKIYGSNGAFTILDSTNGVNRFAISSNGNISISNDLEIDGVTTGRGELRLTEGTSDVSQGAEIGSLMFLNPANDNKNAKIAALRTTGTSGADLAFYTRTHGDATNNDGGIERLRIDSAGNVGVGTNVVSDSSGNARAFTIARSDANGQVRLILKNQATGFGNGAGYHQGIDGANVFIENRTNGGYIDFATFDSGGSYGSRLRITSTEIDAQVPITGAVPAPNRNIIENGEFLISQRFENSSSTKANSGSGIVNGVENGVVDRWRMASPGASNIARQRVTDAPDGFAYSFKVTNDSSQFNPSNANYSFFQQIIEATNVARLAFGTSSAKTVTLSFYVKSSYASSTWAVALGSLTGGVYPGNATRTHIKSYTVSSANTWERKTITFPGDTSGTWPKTGTGGGLAVIWDLGSGGNHQGTSQNTWASSDDFRFSGAKNVADAANGSWQITGIQLEIGDTATEYEHVPIQYELQRCQRYFYCGNTLGSGSWNSATTFHCAVHHPVAMRAQITQALTRSGVLSNINIEPRDAYDITVFQPAAHTHYSPDHAHTTQVMNFTISGSSTTGYSGTVCIDRNNDQFWVSAEL